MNSYRCRVSDASGKMAQIIREGASEEALLAELSSEGLYALSVLPLSEQNHSDRQRFSRKTIIELTDTLAIMIDSGLSVKDSLTLCETVFPLGRPRQLVATLVSKIRKGSSFHSVVEELKESFPPVYRGLVGIGEKLGSLEQILKQLSRYLNDDKKLKDKLFGSLLYPILVLGMAIMGVVTIVLVVFPKLKGMLSAFNQGSAGKVDALLGSISASFIAGAVVLGSLGVAISLILTVRRSRGAAARAVDSFLLKLPVVGSAILNTDLFLFFFAMQILAANGVSVEDSLFEGANVLSNQALRTGALAMKDQIETGVHLSAAFLSQPQFPQRIGRWVAIGESVGAIDKVFGELKAYYQTELEKWTTRFMNLIEPALIILVGAIMLYLVFTFIVPIFSLLGNLV